MSFCLQNFVIKKQQIDAVKKETEKQVICQHSVTSKSGMCHWLFVGTLMMQSFGEANGVVLVERRGGYS